MSDCFTLFVGHRSEKRRPTPTPVADTGRDIGRARCKIAFCTPFLPPHLPFSYSSPPPFHSSSYRGLASTPLRPLPGIGYSPRRPLPGIGYPPLRPLPGMGFSPRRPLPGIGFFHRRPLPGEGLGVGALLLGRGKDMLSLLPPLPCPSPGRGRLTQATSLILGTAL